MSRAYSIGFCTVVLSIVFVQTPEVRGQGPQQKAFLFGSRDIQCTSFNEPAVTYTVVQHVGGDPDSLQYDRGRGWGYEVIRPEDASRGGFGVFGPFDDSPNNRNKFSDACPEEMYDSSIGAKDFVSECSAATVDDGSPDTPCGEGGIVPEGIIFRVDDPNGSYRFVGAFGDADNVHAHRILVEDGGSGPPENIRANHVVLVDNFDQAQYTHGETDPVKLGEGVFARVGFDGRIPPPGDGVTPSPQFVNMDENGLSTEGPPNSPVLEVTQGYIRVHQLQGNANDGPGGPRDPNGGDVVVLELWGDARPCTFVRGDANGDGSINLTDGIVILGFLFLGNPEPPCLDGADTEDNGEINITDAIRIFMWLFRGGARPPRPWPSAPIYLPEDCGDDSTPDDLDCRGCAEKCLGP